jgi:hypothetical protein
MSLIKSLALTPAKLAANRANARRSKGPRTPQGRQRTRLNALKHGVCSRAFDRTVINSAEDRKKFAQGFAVLRLAMVPARSAARKLTEKLARMIWTRSHSAGPHGRQPFFVCSRRELAVLARASEICEWWYGDKVPLATYAAFAGDATNPQCPLESTDRNSVSSLSRFITRQGMASAMPKRSMDFLPFPLVAPCGGALPPRRRREEKPTVRIPLTARLKACPPTAW